VLIGPRSATAGYAVAPEVNSKKVLTIFPIVSAEDITQRKRSPYIVRAGWSSARPRIPSASGPSFAATSSMLKVRGPMIVRGELPARMKLDPFMKDLHLIREAAAAATSRGW